jgi:hypothetical protein
VPAVKKAKRKPVARAKAAQGSEASFETTFHGLKRMLAAFTPQLHLTVDEPRKTIW